MGLNPFRKQRKNLLDIGLLIGFAVLTVAVVFWGFFG
jgi:hypothetical protein